MRLSSNKSSFHSSRACILVAACLTYVRRCHARVLHRSNLHFRLKYCKSALWSSRKVTWIAKASSLKQILITHRWFRCVITRPFLQIALVCCDVEILPQDHEWTQCASLRVATKTFWNEVFMRLKCRSMCEEPKYAAMFWLLNECSYLIRWMQKCAHLPLELYYTRYLLGT